MTPVLEFLNVSRSFKKGTPVLDGVSFSVGEGEVVGLLGRNGAGKTTLIHIAMGLLSPHGGAVRVFGVSPLDDPVAKSPYPEGVFGTWRSPATSSRLANLVCT